MFKRLSVLLALTAAIALGGVFMILVAVLSYAVFIVLSYAVFLILVFAMLRHWLFS